MTRWFRFYDEALNDPKILKLPDSLFRIWVGILCVASKNEGDLPPVDDLAMLVRVKPEKMADAIRSLIKSGLIDDDGVVTKPHNWDGRQYKSDVSTERVKRFRKRGRNVSETPPDTEQIQKTETEQKEDGAAAPLNVVSISPSPEKLFFDQAVQILGPEGRSLAAKLLKSKERNVFAAHAALLTAAGKSEPKQYIGAIIRGDDEDEEERRRRRSF